MHNACRRSEHRLDALADDEEAAAISRPQLHCTQATKHPALDLCTLEDVRLQCNPLNSCRLVRGGIAQQCEQARLSCPRAEWAARMKAKHLVDIIRQCCDVDLTGLLELFLMQSMTHWPSLLPKHQTV